MNFNGRGQHDLLRGSQALFIGERLQEELGCIPDIDKRLLDRHALVLRIVLPTREGRNQESKGRRHKRERQAEIHACLLRSGERIRSAKRGSGLDSYNVYR
jgi:hypothetical protein